MFKVGEHVITEDGRLGHVTETPRRKRYVYVGLWADDRTWTERRVLLDELRPFEMIGPTKPTCATMQPHNSAAA